MRLKDYKELMKYIGKDKFIYILTDGLKFDPITERRKFIMSLIALLPKDKYVRMNCNASNKGKISLSTMSNKHSANSIVIKHSVFVPLLEKNNLSLDVLLGKKDILIKTKEDVNKQCLRKKERIENREATSQRWEKRTREELLKKSTKYEKMVFKKLKSFFEGYYFMSKHIWHNLDDIPIVGKLILVEDDTEEKYTLYRVGSIDDYKQLAYHFNIKRWLYVEELC